jgi:hypothetical protein
MEVTQELLLFSLLSDCEQFFCYHGMSATLRTYLDSYDSMITPFPDNPYFTNALVPVILSVMDKPLL